MGIATDLNSELFVKNLTSSRFEPPTIVKKKPARWNDHQKKQYFTAGVTAGGSASNKLIYGSVDDTLQSQTAEPCVSKYYTQSSTGSYNRSDYTHFHNNSKMSNAFSLSERTSAEIKKRVKQAKEVEEERTRCCKEKEESQKARRKEKEEDLNLLKSYKEPWGKPGAGAPKDNNARTMEVHRLSDSREHILSMGKPGGGAPMRTMSGTLRAKTNVDPEIRFQKRDRGQVLDVLGPDARYLQPHNPFMTDLDVLARRTREERNVVKRDENTTDYNFYDPFGKPGAGAPNKDTKGNVAATRTFNLARTVQETDPMGEIKKFNNRPKWNAFNKRQHLKTDGERHLDKEKQQKYCEELEQFERTKIERHQKEIVQNKKDSLKHADTWNNVWGRPGNGAPLVSSRRHKADVFDQQVDKLFA